MKTSIQTLADYKDVEIEKKVDLSGLNDYVEKELKFVARAHKQKVKVNDIEKGNIVVLSLESQMPKLNSKSIKIAVGSGLFDKELESKIIGLFVDEEKEVIVHDQKVKVKVLESVRNVYPSINDEMIQEYVKDNEEFQDIKTVEEYKEYLKNSYKKDVYKKLKYQNVSHIIDYILTHSDWNFDEDEIKAASHQYMSELEEELQGEGKTFNELTDEELKMYFDVKNKDEFYQVLHNTIECLLAYNVYKAYLLNVDCKDMTLDEVDSLECYVIDNYVEEQMEKIF